MRRTLHNPCLRNSLLATVTREVNKVGCRLVASTASKSFPFVQDEEVDICIEDLTNLGLGIGRKVIDNGASWVVMVPFVLPGERVRVKIHHNYKTYSEASLVEVQTPSADRITPKCQHFATCGGCQYQHMSISSQRSWKQSQVATAMTKIAGLSDITVNKTVGTSHEYYYRSKITPHLQRSSAGDQKVCVGFQQRNTRDIVDVKHCMVASKLINAKYTHLRDILMSSSSNAKFKEGPMLLRESNNGTVVTDGNKDVQQKVGDIEFQFQAREFFQNNPYVLELLVQHVLDKAVGHGCKHLVDTYCGSGLFALSAAKHFQSVYGVEISTLSVDAAQNNAKRNYVNHVKFVKGDAKTVFSKLKKVPPSETVVIVDPPRKGCDASFMNQLLAFKPRKIVYISCEPTTQARDAKRIVQEGGYKITDLTPFDMFPQTRHIENVITFVLP